jgi:aldehyde:ferredoxin oxidoreductase
MADEFGLDTISLGNTLGFAMETSEKGLIAEKINWGDFTAIKELIIDIAYRRELGAVLADGVRIAAEIFGKDSSDWAMHVKGLEVSAYDCRTTPGMALAYGTSSIGAHHKDAWIITWEIRNGRENYEQTKLDYLIKTQLIRGGAFEAFTVCRFPHNTLGLELEWYHKYLRAATGLNFSMDNLNLISDRILTLIRAFWIREYSDDWNRKLDLPPMRWFKHPLSEGVFRGARLDLEKYNAMLDIYYQKRGWNQNGIPTRETFEKLGLAEVANQLSMT